MKDGSKAAVTLADAPLVGPEDGGGVDRAGRTHPDDHRFGETVRAFRIRKRLSLRELALRTGLSVGMLSQIERNVTSPSLKTLTKLRIGLDVPLSAMFEDEGDAPGPSGPHSIVRREAARPTLDIGEGVLKVLLSPATASNLQVMMLIIEPGGGTKDTVVGLPGEKAAVVMAGMLEITVADETYLVNEGDTIQFNAEAPHFFRNPGADETRVMWIIGQLPAQRHI
jgi:transcriptional regulator with XRE-family HTH domain